MGRRTSPSPLSEYFALLEARYGDRFSLDALTDDELARLAGLGEQALLDQGNTSGTPDFIAPLLGLVQGKLQRRAQNRLITSRLSS